jgi:hypothetical protein
MEHTMNRIHLTARSVRQALAAAALVAAAAFLLPSTRTSA